MWGFLLYKDDLSTAKMLYFYLAGYVLRTTEVRNLILAAAPHLTAGGWDVGYMGAGLADTAPPNPPIAHTGYVTACRLGSCENPKAMLSILIYILWSTSPPISSNCPRQKKKGLPAFFLFSLRHCSKAFLFYFLRHITRKFC